MATNQFKTTFLCIGEIITDLNKEESEYLYNLKDARKKLMYENLKKEMHPSTQKHLKDINNKIKTILNSNLYMVISHDNYSVNITPENFPNTFQLIKNNFSDSDYFELEVTISGYEEYEVQTLEYPGYNDLQIENIEEAEFYSNEKKVAADNNVLLEIDSMENLFEPIYDGSFIIPEEDFASYQSYADMADIADNYDRYASNSLDNFIKKTK